jgi:hypothetical protein
MYESDNDEMRRAAESLPILFFTLAAIWQSPHCSTGRGSTAS